MAPGLILFLLLLLLPSAALAQAVLGGPIYWNGPQMVDLFDGSTRVGWVNLDYVDAIIEVPKTRAALAKCSADLSVALPLTNALRAIGNNGMDMMVECIKLQRPECSTPDKVNGWLLWMSGWVKQRLIDGK